MEAIHERVMLKYRLLSSTAAHLLPFEDCYNTWMEADAPLIITELLTDLEGAIGQYHATYGGLLANRVWGKMARDEEHDEPLDMDHIIAAMTIAGSSSASNTPREKRTYGAGHVANARVEKRNATAEPVYTQYLHYMQSEGPLLVIDRVTKRLSTVVAMLTDLPRPVTADIRAEAKARGLGPLHALMELSLTQLDRLPLAGLWELVAHRLEQINIELLIAGPAAILDALANCRDCGTSLTPHSQIPVMYCEQCGRLEPLCGERAEQPGKVKMAARKHHNPNVHCEKHLLWLQAKEDDFPLDADDPLIEALHNIAKREYRRNGKQRSMENMRCEEIRLWLKQLRRTELNVHAPKLRQLITALNGEELVPPRLTEEEHDDVIMDFSIAADLFERVSKDAVLLAKVQRATVKNHPFYPYILFHVLMHHISDRSRMQRFVDCIHFQSASTLKKNDTILAEIISQMEGYTYSPTRPSDWR